MLTSAKLLILLFLVQVHQICYSASNNSCIPSSCGHIRNISYPFRLKTDPVICGQEEYELACENNVPEINYNNFTIRLADSDVQSNNYCSLPPYPSTTAYSFPSLFYSAYPTLQYIYGSGSLYQDLVFVTCPKPVITEVYVDASPCNITYNSSSSSPNSETEGYSYVKVGSDGAMDLEDSCRIERIYITSLLPKDLKNVSYADVHRSLVYGFELSWFWGCCRNYTENGCKLDAATIIDHCNPGSGIIQFPQLRSLLLKLEKTVLGRLLRRLGWDPSLYFDLDLQGYVLALLRYALVLFGKSLFSYS
ncbi:hypothetical protein P3X46_000843 [Hevea brasiliensis]|uniref:Wall-associated receptor kinase galacturonan-binding domain-containing protein n=1 Tax=Hevea brasiliensis TaxID=3981 RepID=A0ABQ9NCP9_HEVBR|nr:hypothetical protein P3X46_000843 [Hevea brasiliensis]